MVSEGYVLVLDCPGGSQKGIYYYWDRGGIYFDWARGVTFGPRQRFGHGEIVCVQGATGRAMVEPIPPEIHHQ